MARAGFDVTVLTTDRTRTLPKREVRDGYTVVRVAAWPRARDYHFAPGIYRRIARGRWALVHVQSYHTFVAPLAMIAATRARTPYLLTFHGGGHSSWLRNRLRGLQRLLLRPLLRRAARLIAVAAFEIEAYGAELGLARDRFALIPNGVDPLVAPAADAAGDHSGALIASVGRLERYKGHHRVLEALPHVLAVRPDARLWIAGSGPFEDALRARVAELGLGDRVEIESVDNRSAMAAQILRADLVVLMSEFETQPLAVLEAASLRRPVLVADNSGLREMAERGLARAIPTDSPPTELAAAILSELATPVSPPPVDLPSWDECAAAVLDLYEGVLGPRPASTR